MRHSLQDKQALKIQCLSKHSKNLISIKEKKLHLSKEIYHPNNTFQLAFKAGYSFIKY